MLERFPFVDDIIMSEDQEWSRRVLLEGYELRYVADAVVRHSHPYTLAQAFRRFFDRGVSRRARVPDRRRRRARRCCGGRAFEYAREELRWLSARGAAALAPLRRSSTRARSSSGCSSARAGSGCRGRSC